MSTPLEPIYSLKRSIQLNKPLMRGLIKLIKSSLTGSIPTPKIFGLPDLPTDGQAVGGRGSQEIVINSRILNN